MSADAEDDLVLSGRLSSEGQGHGGAEVEDNLEYDRVDTPVEKSPNWSFHIIKMERSIFELHRRWADGEIAYIRSSDLQKHFEWDLPKQSRLVESVLARIPLPVVYLSDESDDSLLIIDGWQRLTALFDYRENVFALRNLRLLPHLNGKRFRDLDARLKRRFEDTPITAYVIQPGSNPEVKFEVFERLNQGAVELNAQEIRNSLFRGAGLEMIKHLARPEGPFRKVAGAQRSFSRMKADELVLRAIAFIDRTDEYRGDMKQFLNEELQRLNQMGDVERTKLRELFEHSLEVTERVFGDKAFRRYQPRAQIGYSPELNAALMDVVVWGFTVFAGPVDSFWAPRADAVVAMSERLQERQDFRDAITYGTGDTRRVETRFTLWKNGLSDVLRDHG